MLGMDKYGKPATNEKPYVQLARHNQLSMFFQKLSLPMGLHRLLLAVFSAKSPSSLIHLESRVCVVGLQQSLQLDQTDT